MSKPTAAAGSAARSVSAEPAAAVGGIDHVESRTFTIRDFPLECGKVLAEAAIAYETYGRLDATGRNAVLLAHGFTSSHHAAGRYAADKAPRGLFEHEPGWREALVGPGRAIDTDRLFAVSSNMLGSSYGSTNPASLDPATGKPYGPDFPPITLADMVRAQRLLLEHLGVRHLVAVAGPSFGGYQAFQWAVTFPDFMDGIVAAVTAPKGSGGERAVQDLVAQLGKHPNWNGGFYYDKGGIRTAMIEFRVAHMVVSKTTGHFTDYQGFIDMDAEAGTVKTIEATIKTASVNTSHEKRDAHLRITGVPSRLCIVSQCRLPASVARKSMRSRSIAAAVGLGPRSSVVALVRPPISV